MSVVWIDLALAALMIAARLFLFQIVFVKGRSMLSTLEHHQVLWVSMLDYRLRAPQRGDVVICHYPGRKMKNLPFLMNFVKRVIGLPGETIEIIEGAVHINGLPLDEPYLDPAHTRFHANRPAVILGEDEYFVMGDNRDNSNDSRRVGPLKQKMIAGRVKRILLPLAKARRV